MKKMAAALALGCLICTSTFSQQQKKLEDQIRQYWFVMLTAGNNRSQDSSTAVKIQQGHLDQHHPLEGMVSDRIYMSMPPLTPQTCPVM